MTPVSLAVIGRFFATGTVQNGYFVASHAFGLDVDAGQHPAVLHRLLDDGAEPVYIVLDLPAPVLAGAYGEAVPLKIPLPAGSAA